MEQGWFKLHRELLEKAIWQNSTPEQKVILITLLSMANHEGREWEWNGKQFKADPGQFVTSIDSIIKKAGKGISSKNVRTALEKFEKYGFLANESTKTGRLITIVNWRVYQSNELEGGKDNGRQVADRWQRGGKEVAPNKNDKNDKNDKNINNNNNNTFSEVIKHYEKCNFILSPMIFQKLEVDIEMYGINEVMKAAELSDEKGVHTYNYAKAIMEKRRNQGVNGRDSKQDNNSEEVQYDFSKYGG